MKKVCSSCFGKGKKRVWIFWTKTCSVCDGKGIVDVIKSHPVRSSSMGDINGVS